MGRWLGGNEERAGWVRGAAAEHDGDGGLDVEEHLAGVGVEDGMAGEFSGAVGDTVGEVAEP